MAPWQKTVLTVVVAVLGMVMLLTWGSVGSALIALCLLIMGGALLYQKFITNRDEEDYWAGTEG